MALNTNDITVTSLETITAFDPTTGEFLWVLDELQDATIANEEETTDITGKQGRLLNTLKRNKTVTISGSNGLLSGGLMATQTGGEFESMESTEIMWVDYLTVNASNQATTTFTAVGDTGAEIVDLYVKNADNTIGAKLTQDASVGAGKFTYNTATKMLTFNSDVTEGTAIVAYYKRNIKGDVLVNMSDTYSKKAALYIDAFGEDRCAQVFRIQFYVPVADFSGTFDIQMGDEQAVHAFEARSLSSSCDNASAAKLWTYTIFGGEAEDVTP